MMELTFKRITNSNSSDFESCWMLYDEAFPTMERRELVVQSHILSLPDYHFEAVYADEELAGFILWWQFDGIVYIEHLATLATLRGKGIGAGIIERLLGQTNDMVVLEVEPPVNRNNKRRINFYSRLGFQMNHHIYYQPPLRKGGEEVELLLMSSPGLLSGANLNHFRSEFREHCFLPVAKYIL